MTNKFFNNYLIKLNDGWLDVKGKIIGGKLHWQDARDGATGIATEFMEYYPRPLSDAERGIKK